MFKILNAFTHKAEIRESKDEMLIGEVVRAMARSGHPAIAFRAHSDRQMVRFKTIRDEVLNSIWVTLDRKTGTGAIADAVLGSKATLTVTAEIKNHLTDPDDLVAMYRTDLANIFKVPMMGGVKLNHELNSVYATTSLFIEINKYVMKGDVGAAKLRGELEGAVTKLREKLVPYKKG